MEEDDQIQEKQTFHEDLQDDAQSDITSVTQQNEVPSRPTVRRSSSNLTIENLRRHEEAIIREEKEQSLKGSSQSGRGTPLDALRTGSPLVPVQAQSRQSSAGQKSLKDDVDIALTPGESLRTGSGKPLPPIGVERSEDENAVEEADIPDNVLREDSIAREDSSALKMKSSHPSILQRPFRRESNTTEGVDRETLLSAKSVKSATSRSERSVSFKDHPDRGGSAKPLQQSIRLAESPAVREVHRHLVHGQEKVSVSIATETEWSWLESLKLAGLEDGTQLPPSSAGSLSQRRKKSLSTPSHDSNFSDMNEGDEEEDKETAGESEDEDDQEEVKRRVPPLQIDADSEESDTEAADKDNLIPSIGPPRIIQYQREMERPYPNQDLMPVTEDEDDLGPIQGVSDVSLPLSEIREESAVCEFCHGEIKQFPTPEMRDNFTSEELYCCPDYHKFVEFAITNTPLSAQPSDELIDITPHAPYGSKQARRAAKERAAARLREREIARQRAAGANQANFYAFARQMKTINYTLSSQKCLDEGWTLRPETPDDSSPPPLAYEPVRSTTPPLKQTLKGAGPNETPIIERFYPSGERFMVMFEDGSGTVFYASGNTALHIVKVENGQFIYIAQDEVEKGAKRGALLALFEPHGRGTCYHKNGNIRLNMDQSEGTFADSKGALKKRWHWWDHTTHVHAPPFQPICFALNSALSVRCLAQDQIFLSFSQDKMSLRFNVGVKLKLVAPENIPTPEIDEDELYLAEVRAYVQLVVDKISNQLHFSKSPKLGDIHPPRKLKNDFIRNERKKQENCSRKAMGRGTTVVTVN
ncbi:uncharacterized protein [Apostichopus japonicus]|uniref:uncharacterized protein n=1 Tax=Stichopus japonicus TaxID=307972 RepID=UPI003AB56CDB